MCTVSQHHSKQLTVAETLTGSKWQQTQVQELVRVCLVLSHLVCLMIIQMPLATFGMSPESKALPVSVVTYEECSIMFTCHGMF